MTRHSIYVLSYNYNFSKLTLVYVNCESGTLQVLPIGIHFLLSLLSIIAVRRQARLFLPKETIPWSLHPGRYALDTHFCLVMNYSCHNTHFWMHYFYRIPIRLCIWLDHFEISPDRLQPTDEGMLVISYNWMTLFLLFSFLTFCFLFTILWSAKWKN